MRFQATLVLDVDRIDGDSVAPGLTVNKLLDRFEALGGE